MRLNFSSPLFLFILLFSPFTTGNFQNAFALTPVADLTGNWSGFAQVSFANGNCETTGKVNAHLTQHENDIEGRYSFVPTSVKANLEGAECDPSFLAITEAIRGTIDGSRITLYSEGATFSGWYASSGIKLDITADEIRGTTQLSPTGFTPPAFAPKDTDGDGIPDSKDACPNDPAPGTVDGCPEKNTQEKAEAEKAAAEQAAATKAKAAQEKAEAEKAAAEQEDSKSAKLLRQMENEPEPKDWAEAGEPTVNGNSEQILQNQKAGNLKVYKGSATITTADGTVVDSNELKIGQTIQTGENDGTNVQIKIGNGATMNLKEKTRVSTVGIISTDGKNLSIINDDIDQELIDKLASEELAKTRPGTLDKELKFKHIVGVVAGGFIAGLVLPELLIATGVIGAVGIVGYALHEGSVYFATSPSKDLDGENHSNVIFTPGGAFVHKKTEFTVTVEGGTTKLNVLDGEVYFVPYDNSPLTVINSGNSILVSDNKVEKTKLNTASIDRWWDKALTLEQQGNHVSDNNLVKNQSVKYTLVVEVKSDNEEVKTGFEKIIASSFLEEYADAKDITIETPGDIEWLKATVMDNSPQDVWIQIELKVKEQQRPFVKKLENLSDSSSPTIFFISTTGIDKGHVIKIGSGKGGFPSQLVLDKNVNLNIGGSSITAYEFSGNIKTTTDDGSYTDFTITNHYEKYTGILVDYLVTGKAAAPEIGTLAFSVALKATEIIIPTTLSISLPSEIQEDKDLVVTGTISPATSEGHVVLKYQKDNSNTSPIRRTVSVTNGTFSDSHKLELGSYTVSAEYLGSGAYLSSKTDTKILNVTTSGGCLIATAAFGSELAPQIQQLRETRDSVLLHTASGSAFMTAFNQVYYTFSPTVADWERENPYFKEIVKITITPLITTLSILNYVQIHSEVEMLSYGIGIILLNIGMYFVAPAFVIFRLKKRKN